jgi:hypothetical protein
MFIRLPGEDNRMSKDDYLGLQANAICLLLFLIATTAITEHPAWFQ